MSFRLWQRPRVKVGNRYSVEGAQIEIDSIELVPFSSISRADVRRSGELNRELLRNRAAHAGPIDDDTLLLVYLPKGVRLSDAATQYCTGRARAANS